MKKIVIWQDGTWLKVQDGITWEYENDSDWLLTLEKKDFKWINHLLIS